MSSAFRTENPPEGERSWKSMLGDRIPTALGREIDGYEETLAQKREGAGPDDAVFAEMRLRRGAYGQRYDNGQRHDGATTRVLKYPRTATKGPGTLWDAPGMQRIKIPYGGMNAEQLEVLAELAEEYSDDILHVTTRQDVQLHFVHLDDTPDLMRRLAAVGITTREACGNVVRNVTACPKSGCCKTETFDVTPYAQATHEFVLGHPDTQDFGRKFKIAFSGCAEEACALASLHDAGCIAKTRIEHGVTVRGFEFYVGGGLGAVPYHAVLFDPFLPEEELLPTIQAIGRVFARLGEKKNRARARLKFLVNKLGLEAFKALVHEERQIIPPDPRHTSFLENLEAWDGPTSPPSELALGVRPEGFDAWAETNVIPQRQSGYVMVVVHLPLGDLTARQARSLADLSRQVNGGKLRTTVEQNIMLRWVPQGEVVRVYEALAAMGLGRPGAGTIVDVVACPGTDTCKLGVSSSRGLGWELSTRLAAQAVTMDAAVKNLRIKVSGCFNSCGQHHVADIGFWGVSRKKGNYVVPNFQVVLGGEWANNAGSYGLAMGAAPSKNIPQVVERITSAFVAGRSGDETFQQYIQRIGKSRVRELIDDLLVIPEFDVAPDFYRDWGDPRTFAISDIGVGECAGEIVPSIDFDLLASEREVFQAQDRLDQRDVEGAATIAYRAMMLAAKALAKTKRPTIQDDPATVMEAFVQEFYDTKLFFDPFAGAKFARYYMHAHEETNEGVAPTPELARKRIEEAQLFVEAAHACYARMSQQGSL